MERDIDGEVSFRARLEKLGIAVLHSWAWSDPSGPVVSRSLSLFQSWNYNFPFFPPITLGECMAGHTVDLPLAKGL